MNKINNAIEYFNQHNTIVLSLTNDTSSEVMEALPYLFMNSEKITYCSDLGYTRFYKKE